MASLLNINSMALDLSKYGVEPSTPTGSFDLSKYGVQTADQLSTIPTRKTLSQEIWGSINTRANALHQNVTNTNQNPIVGGIKAAAQPFGGIGDTFGALLHATPVVGSIARGVEGVIGKGFTATTDALANTN